MPRGRGSPSLTLPRGRPRGRGSDRSGRERGGWGCPCARAGLGFGDWMRRRGFPGGGSPPPWPSDAVVCVGGDRVRVAAHRVGGWGLDAVTGIPRGRGSPSLTLPRGRPRGRSEERREGERVEGGGRGCGDGDAQGEGLPLPNPPPRQTAGEGVGSEWAREGWVGVPVCARRVGVWGLDAATGIPRGWVSAAVALRRGGVRGGGSGPSRRAPGWGLGIGCGDGDSQGEGLPLPNPPPRQTAG